MDGLPSGTVTFLFTDIEGSTRLLKSLGDDYERVLTEHDRCLREAFEEANGQEVDTQGDSFFAVFARAGDAVAAAVGLQRRLPGCDWPAGADVRVRVGVHTAEPKVGQHRYIGIGVHRAARICAAAHGGQILVSSATRELVEDSLPEGIELRDLGSHSLKDLDRPEHIFQLAGPGLPEGFPPIRAAEALVSAETPFAGREGELAAATQASLKRRALSRRSVLLAMLAGVLAAAVAVPLFALGQDDGDTSKTPPAGVTRAPHQDSLAAVDAETAELASSVGVGDLPGPVAVGSSEVWVGNMGDDTISEIDSESLRVVRTIGVPITPNAMAVGDGAVWIAYNGCTATCVERIGASTQRPEDVEPVELVRYDPEKRHIVWRRKLGLGGPGAVDIALSGGSVWVSNEADWTVTRIDPETGKVLGTIDDKVDGPKGLASTPDSVWVLSYPDSWVTRINSATGTVVATVPVEKPWALGAGPAGVWVATRFDSIMWRIDPHRSQTVDSVKIPGLATRIAVGTARIWVVHTASGSLTRVDAATHKATLVKLGRPLNDVAAGAGAAWVTVR